MRLLVFLILSFASLLFAEAQEKLYFRAMEAEQNGDVSESLSLFEQAAAAGGEYTAEIQEILEEYYDALEVKKKNNASYRVIGDIGFYGLHYEEYGGVPGIRETGHDVFTSLAAFLDLSFGDWIHSLGFAFVADWFLNSNEMEVLDTNEWKLAPGLEYSLVGTNMLLDLGVDFNVSSEAHLQPSFYGLFEYDFAHWEKQRLSVSLLSYFHKSGPLSFALSGAWHRTASYGFNGSAYIGVKYEADSLADYLGFLKKVGDYIENSSSKETEGESLMEGDGSYNPYGLYNLYNPWAAWTNGKEIKPYDYFVNQCREDGHSEQECYNYEVLSSYFMAYYLGESERDVDSLRLPEMEYSWSRWIGPTMKLDVFYRFKSRISVEGKFDLYYGFVVDGPSSEYEKLHKFSGTWGMFLDWKQYFFTLYIGGEQIYLRYFMPKSLEGVYPKNSFLTELKFGVKLEF